MIPALSRHLTENDIVLSCWQLSEEEQEYVRLHGKVWLTVWGRQPAVNITAADPFAASEEIPPSRRSSVGRAAPS